ncbi:MAG TPA: tRNA (adenosine(37)-N6)-threonylcarbamoyltransferase complex dimerization subunit type 1 TsaB [Burkholderiales bacterium]|nr:tRNA (adenosine(37)-N6)-threonylcarbamoyltransferase complex dimerization subunit type 1 TsaB [Burkholderiales bacterium]
MKLLALDTSTEACSVALMLDQDIVERFELEQRHGERLLTMVEELLKQSDIALSQLDAIAFGRGPGSFTSLRIGAGVVQGLAFGADLPVVPVSSLAALAQGIDAPKVLAAFDARMRQVYYGAFVRGSDGLVMSAGAEVVVNPAELPLPDGTSWTGAGSGWDAYHESMRERLGTAVDRWLLKTYPHAREVAVLACSAFSRGLTVPADEAIPVYIRDDVAMKSSKRGG